MFRNLRLLGHVAVAVCGLVGRSGTGMAGAQSACADLGGTVDPDQICHVHSASSSYTLDFSFPVSYPDQQALTDFLTHERDQEADYAAQFPPAPDRLSWSGGARGRYDLAATGTAYRSGTSASGTQSLVFAIDDDTGAANEGRPVTSYKAFNYDLSKGAPITFDTLFKPGTNPLEVLNPIVQRKFGPLPFGDPGVHAYQNFAVTDGAVIFFFNQGHVLAQLDGPQKVSVPRAELASLLASP